MIPNLPEEDKCFGCGACVNVCPVGAIGLAYKHFFLSYDVDESSCIGCKKCEAACPSLNPTFVNSETPQLYAYCADDETRSVSSSGGMFTSLARYVIEQGGVVCGAAFDDNLVLRHQFADNSDDLARFRGSKYLQSDVGDCYKKVEELLESGRQVLFVGTPCQVAALRGVLGRPYDNLLMADLLCHGAPSQLFFDKYVYEVAGERDVCDVSFRDKRFGWACSHIATSFADGGEHVGSLGQKANDPYMFAFKKKMMMRDTCHDCPFCEFPRQGDITMGDLWQSSKLDPKSNDGKGTSFVFLNNEKGESVYKTLEPGARYSNKIEREPDQYRTIPNRVYRVSNPSPHRSRFLELVRHRSFSSAVSEAQTEKYDIGLPALLHAANIGSVLTYWSLYNALVDMGYSVRTFGEPFEANPNNTYKSEEFVKRWVPAHAVPMRFKSVMDMRVLDEMCDMFVVGSDQIWLESMCKGRGSIFFLQFATGVHKKVAYSSSFGMDPSNRYSDDYYNHLRYYLNKFDAITCREDSGVSFANSDLHLECHVEFALDPVFLCDKQRFEELCDAGEPFGSGPFASAYVVKPNERMANLLKRVLEVRSLDEARCCLYQFDSSKNTALASFDPQDSFPIEDTLRSFRDSDIVVTDSFHGVCFAILFRKDFVTIPRDFEDRFVSLLKRLDLQDRIIDIDLDNLTEGIVSTHIDYDAVYAKLEPLIDRSRRLLEDALRDDVRERHLDDIDIAMEHIFKQQKTLNDLQERLKGQTEKTNALQAQLDAQAKDNRNIDERVKKFERTWKKIQQSAFYRLYKKI